MIKLPKNLRGTKENVSNLQEILSQYTYEKTFLSEKAAREIIISGFYPFILAVNEQRVYILKNPNYLDYKTRDPYKNRNGSKSSQDFRVSIGNYLNYWLNVDEVPTTWSLTAYYALANFFENKCI